MDVRVTYPLVPVVRMVPVRPIFGPMFTVRGLGEHRQLAG